MMLFDANGADFPPVSSEGEQSIPDQKEFVGDCLSQLSVLRKMGEVHIGNQLVTQSPIWGTIFRADFTIDKRVNPNSVDRLICWKRADGRTGSFIAMGQPVPPL